jgi:hypothetical protein
MHFLGETTMKLAFVAMAIAVTGCASKPASPPAVPLPADTRPIGQSQMAPRAAALCIAQKWANSSGQTVYAQYVFANDTAFDVYAPGQQPPSGSAAMVRPAASGPGSAVGFRGPEATIGGVVGQCA